MRAVVYLASAKRDFRAIQRYLTRQSRSIDVGVVFVEALQRQCQRLAALPGTLGRSRPELGAGIRGFPYRSYVIFFRYDTDIFEIVNVLEGHRDVIGHFRDDSG